MSNQKEAILAEMGIKPLWRLRDRVGEFPVDVAAGNQTEIGPSAIAAPSFVVEAAVDKSITQQGSTATHAEDVRPEQVLAGSYGLADWLFVSEGAAPLSAQANKLLDAMLAAIQLKRGENVHVLDNGQPFQTEQCGQTKPKLIVALGQPAAQRVLGGEVEVEASRGRLFSYQDIPVIVSYHPDDLLNHAGHKARSWEDLCFAQDQMQRA
jgi:DNA polymerase